MAQVEVILPRMGESVAEATITKWLKAEGDAIEAEESLVEIATDKVDSEIPAPADGVVAKILVQEGEVVKVGQAIAVIATEGEEANPDDSALTEHKPQAITAKQEPSPKPITEASLSPPSSPEPEAAAATTPLEQASAGRFYSPLVKSIAKAEGVPMEELDTVPGTGKDGRVTKQDILKYVKNGQRKPALQPSSSPQPPEASSKGNTEIIEMGRMRKLIAEHMVLSKQTSPHVTSFVEADVTNIVNWLNSMKKRFEEREGQKLTYTPIFIEAAVKAIKDFPMINVSVDGSRIIKKNYINIGMATALPSGNLIVPVIKNAGALNLAGLVKAVNDLANRARNSRLEPDETQDGTFTLTNLGSFGNIMGTPIINQPQAAILATGVIRKKPVVIETGHGDLIGIRHMMFLSLSYDHRVVDGALGGNYLKRTADYLEQFNTNTVI